MVIRLMAEHDIPAVLEMGKAMHHESAYRDMVFSEDKCEKLLFYLLSDPQNNFAIVAVNDTGELAGMMAASVTEHYFSDDKMVQDYLLYVRPEDRGGTIASRIFAKFLEWVGKLEGMKFIQCGITTEVDMQKSIRLYEHFDFRVAGVMMRQTS